jgi:hypothetical protein
MKTIRFTIIALSLLATAALGQTTIITTNPPVITTNNVTVSTNSVPSPATNSVVTTGPITVITGDATSIALTWIAQHGSAGAEWFHSLKGGKNGPGVTETAWLTDLPWNTGLQTNIDFRVGLTHDDVFTKTVNQDLLGLELSADFFNGNIAQAVHNWPVIGVIWKSLAKINLETTVSIAHTTDGLANAHIEGKNTDWGVGVKVVKLF